MEGSKRAYQEMHDVRWIGQSDQSRLSSFCVPRKVVQRFVSIFVLTTAVFTTAALFAEDDGSCTRQPYPDCKIDPTFAILRTGYPLPETFYVQSPSHPIDQARSAEPRMDRRLDQRSRVLRPEARLLHVGQEARTINRVVAQAPTHRTTVTTTTDDVRTKGSLASSSKQTRTVEEALAIRGSISFRKTPLSEAVFLLSDLWHINIVAGENVTGEVSGTFHEAPLREVLSAALTAAGYSYRQMGNSLIVLPIDQVGSDDPTFQAETILIPPSLRGDDSALEAARLLLSAQGRLQRIGTSGLLIIDSSTRISRVRQLFTSLVSHDSQRADTSAPASVANPDRGGIAYFTPQYTEAEGMVEPLQMALGEQVIVAAYPSENRIVIKGSADDLRLATEAIRQLDVPRPQVRITAMIYDVGLSELQQLGVNWSRDLRVNANIRNEALENLTSPIDELFRFNADLTSTGGASIGLTTLTDTFAASAILEALDNTSEAKLLADPSITVGDRRPASIRIVRRIPIVGANPVEGSNAVFTQTEFEEAGVILMVEPRISRDGTIELKVQPEYSVVAELTPSGPVIDSRQADTTVRVANGQMFVLGGLRQKTIVESVRGIPYLKDFKYVGKLFRSHDTEVRESELIVFLRPEIITPCFPGDPRQQQAACIANKQLDQIPYAESVPATPYCQDPYCPNHHPRPRINGGSDWAVGQPLSVGEPMILSEENLHSQDGVDQPSEEIILEPSALQPLSNQDHRAPTPRTDRVIADVDPPLFIDARAMKSDD